VDRLVLVLLLDPLSLAIIPVLDTIVNPIDPIAEGVGRVVAIRVDLGPQEVGPEVVEGGGWRRAAGCAVSVCLTRFPSALGWGIAGERRIRGVVADWMGCGLLARPEERRGLGRIFRKCVVAARCQQSRIERAKRRFVGT